MTLSRRHVLAASAALPAAMMTSPSSAQNAPEAQAPGFYRYRAGDIVVTAINDGIGERPLEGFIRNAELKDVQAALREAFMPTDKLALTFTSLVLETGGKVVLIDTGNGDLGPPTAGKWMANFKAAGFDPAKVDTVIISHFHGDHINGLRLKDGTAVFPKATVMVPEPEWAFWMDDAKMNAAPDAAKPGFQNVRRVFAPISADVKKFAWDQDVIPGVKAIGAPGHTPGHTTFDIGAGATRLRFMADVSNHPALFVRHPEWSAVFDMNADEARATRIKFLNDAAQERFQVAFYHAPFPATGYVAKAGEGFAFVPVNWSSRV